MSFLFFSCHGNSYLLLLSSINWEKIHFYSFARFLPPMKRIFCHPDPSLVQRGCFPLYFLLRSDFLPLNHFHFSSKMFFHVWERRHPIQKHFNTEEGADLSCRLTRWCFLYNWQLSVGGLAFSSIKSLILVNSPVTESVLGGRGARSEEIYHSHMLPLEHSRVRNRTETSWLCLSTPSDHALTAASLRTQHFGELWTSDCAI